MKKLITGVSLFACISATAQVDTSQQKTLDEVIVTANKIQQKQSATGKVITVIGKELIEKNAGKTVAQLLNEQAGITINGAFNNLGANQSVYMRGAATGRTLVLIDGIPAYDPSLISNEFDINLLALNEIEKIEISRGAQSTLYGSDAVAGVINIITVKNNISKPLHVKATLAGGSYNTWRGNAQVFGKAGKFIYTTRYAKLYSNGFSAAYDSTGKNNFDKDGYNGNACSANLQYQFSDAFFVRTFFQQSRYTTKLDEGTFKDEKDYRIKNNNTIAGTTVRFIKNNIQFTANYQYSDIKRNYFNDSTDRPGFTTFSTDDYFGKAQFIEAFASIALGKGFTLLQGADYRFANMNSKYFSLSSFGPFESGFKDTVQSQASLYGSLLYTIPNAKLNIELGGRLNVHSRYGNNSTFTFSPSYKLSNAFRIFGSYATSYKAPSLYQLYSDYGYEALQPETAKTFELGVQQTHQKTTNRLVYFKRDINNALDFDNNLFSYFNINKQVVSGVEVETTIVFNAFTARLNYTYLNPREKSQSRVSFKDTTYQYLLRRPAHNANATLSYQCRNGLFISATGKYVSTRFDAGGYKTNDVGLNNYFIVSAYAGFTLKQYIKLFADAQNITNKKFFDVRGYNSIPFLINTGITFNW
jgi:vitamin B12 transporter